MVNPTTYASNIEGLSRIYILEENNLGSVFFEFNPNNKMKIACKNVSKSWELCRDKRVPNEANEHLCFGFTVKESELVDARIHSIQDLIGRVNYWMGGGNILEQKQEIPLISIKSNQLKEQIKKMPVKEYNPIMHEGKVYTPLFRQNWND